MQWYGEVLLGQPIANGDVDEGMLGASRYADQIAYFRIEALALDLIEVAESGSRPKLRVTPAPAGFG
jgi:hypothetical protein